MPNSLVRDHSLWLYGVVIGVAITNAITEALPLEGWLVGVRLATFLLLAVRFYVGAARFFAEYYPGGNRDGARFMADFILGLIHFVLFVALAVAFAEDAPPRWGYYSYFEFVLVGILIFDLPWWWLCKRGTERRERVRYWALQNFATAVLVLGTHAAFEAMLTSEASEAIGLVWVLVFSAVDFYGMATNTEPWLEWAEGLGRNLRKPPGPVAGDDASAPQPLAPPPGDLQSE
jgi:hypothetical protein